MNTGKIYLKKCLHCKIKFIPRSPTHTVCSFDCSRHFAAKKMQQIKKKQQQEWHKEKKARKEKLKTLGDYEKEARKVFQQFIRLRDKDLPCISCGCKTAKQWDGGHYFKAELFSGYIFSEINCHKQCSRCNDLYSGNEALYRIGLVEKIGLNKVEDLENARNLNRVKKYTKQELIEIKEFYKTKIKNLIN